MGLAYNKACELEDFRNPVLVALIRDLFPHDIERFGADFPAGHEYRKYWEVAMAARSLRDFGALGPGAELLGVGAGSEPTIFWLTRHSRRVFATDLYLEGTDWTDSANAGMLSRPQDFFLGEWHPRRLIVQHMDGRELAYEDASFDGVFSCSSIEHFGDLDDVRRALEEMCRVLRPGGIAVLSTELRLAGPPPGLPNVLMFDLDQLQTLLSGLVCQAVDPLDVRVGAATRATAVPFADAAADVRAHTKHYGRLQFEALTWSRYPHIVLEQGELAWTSVNLTLRKPKPTRSGATRMTLAADLQRRLRATKQPRPAIGWSRPGFTQ